MKKLFVIVLIIIGWLILFGKDEWLGFYYPNGCLTCEDQYIYSPKLDSLEDCLGWAEDLNIQRNNPDDLFECGKNCKPPTGDFPFYVCKETIDEY